MHIIVIINSYIYYYSYNYYLLVYKYSKFCSIKIIQKITMRYKTPSVGSNVLGLFHAKSEERDRAAWVSND